MRRFFLVIFRVFLGLSMRGFLKGRVKRNGKARNAVLCRKSQVVVLTVGCRERFLGTASKTTTSFFRKFCGLGPKGEGACAQDRTSRAGSPDSSGDKATRQPWSKCHRRCDWLCESGVALSQKQQEWNREGYHIHVRRPTAAATAVSEYIYL